MDKLDNLEGRSVRALVIANPGSAAQGNVER